MTNFTLEKTIEFVPKTFNDTDEDPISFVLKQPNYLNKDKLRPKDKFGNIDQVQIGVNAFEEFVAEIKNVSVQGTPIDKSNYQLLLSADGASLLVIEVVNKLIDMADGGDILPLSKRSEATSEGKPSKQ